ncbi:DNA gyrase inhibitor YacG [Isosphaeraceae bacterium EP7]
MIRGRCPTCRKEYEGESLAALPHFPFCSARCRLIDLGRWADGTFTIPGKDVPPAEEDKSDEGD